MKNLLFLLTIIVAFYFEEKNKVFWWAFLAGMIFDFIFGFWIGRTSLALLIVGFLAILYARKYSATHFLFQLAFVFLSFFLFSWINGDQPYWQKAIYLVLISFILFSFIRRMKRKKGLKLEV